MIIVDKGFASGDNFTLMAESRLQYIIPLRRNNRHCGRSLLQAGDKSKFDGCFLFNGRAVWYYEYIQNGRRFIMYLDEMLKAKEERDYLQRLEAKMGKYSHEGFVEKQVCFGLIAFHTNLSDTPMEIYKLYKARFEIEQFFDFLNNLLDQDCSYLQDKHAVEAWAFLNHISLMLVYLLYTRLKVADLLSKYSVQDLLIHLKFIQYLKINNSWSISEIPNKTQELLDFLELHIM